jgi:hypothetical protein
MEAVPFYRNTVYRRKQPKLENTNEILTGHKYINIGEDPSTGGSDSSKVEAWSAIAAMFAVTVCAAIAGTSV